VLLCNYQDLELATRGLVGKNRVRKVPGEVLKIRGRKDMIIERVVNNSLPNNFL
jgi:hypothetical protein